MKLGETKEVKADPRQNLIPERTGGSGSLAVTDPFFPVVSSFEIDQSLWCQARPYQLAMLKAVDGEYDLQDTYTLPIGPESYSVSTPFAITTAVTLGGIVEQHNGAPLRTIMIAGTTGVAPFRARGVPFTGPVSGSVGSIFAGTIAAAEGVVNSTQAIFTGNAYRHPNVYAKEIGPLSDLDNSTGYYQFLVLRGFLEAYVTRKKNEPDLRLALIVWKEELAYLVTPISFDLQRQAQAPLEYRYQMQFRAWKRIPLNGVKVLGVTRSLSKTGVTLAKDVLNRLTSARRTILGVKKTIQSIVPDFDGSIGAGLRDVTLGLKDIVGVAKTAWDFPRKFSQYIDREVAVNFRDIDFSTVFDPNLKRQLDQMFKAAEQYSTRAGLDQNPNEARTLSAQDIALGRTQDTSPTSSQKRVAQILAEPDNEGLLDYIQLDSIQLSPEAKAYKEIQELKANAKTRLDYLNLKHQTEIFIADYSDKIGLGNPTFNAMIGKETVAKLRDATVDDLEALHALEDVLNQYSRLASEETEDKDIQNSMEYVATLAGQSSIDFRVPLSKFAVPFPFGGSLEKLARTYLGDPDRWYEIATLNGLREPYVDEAGFSQNLQYSGSGSVVQVADAENLYVGQFITLTSGVLKESRTIKDITELPDGFALTLDGEPDLAKFNTQTVLHAFLPGTVNSGQLIYIPSDEPLDEALLARSVPDQDSIDAFTRVAGWDFMLTSKNDLAVTPDGDVKLAVGMANIIQRIKVIFATPVGSWLHHPNFGFAAQVGQSNAEFTAQQVLDSANSSLSDDPNLSVTSASVEVLGPVVRLNMEVATRGATALLPVSVDVR